MRVVLFSVFILWGSAGLAQEQRQVASAIYYIVAVEGSHLTEYQVALESDANTQAPVAIDALRQTIIPMHIPSAHVPDWEMDLPLLLPDESVLHLVGRAELNSKIHTDMQELNAELNAAHDSRCTAKLSALVQSRQILAQKITVNCLGRLFHGASARLYTEGS